MREEERIQLEEIKQKTDALGKEILQMERLGVKWVKKEIALEDKLVAVFAQMVALEKAKVDEAEKRGAAKEAALISRIVSLQNKQREFEKRKEMIKHLKEKSLAIKEEMANAEVKMREEIAELYRIKEIKKKHAVEQKKKHAVEQKKKHAVEQKKKHAVQKAAQKAAKAAAERAAQKAAEAAAEKAAKKAKAALKLKKAVPAKKPVVKRKKAKPAVKAKKAKPKAKAVKKAPLKKAVKRAKPKKAAAKKPAAVKKAVVKKPVKIKKPKARAPKLKLAKKPAFLEELPEGEEEVEEEEEAAPEEEAVEEEAPAEEAAEEEEAPAEEEAAEEEAVPEEEAQPAEEAAVEEEQPAEAEAEEEPSALLERVLEKAKKEKVAEEEPAAGEEAGAKEPGDYDFTEFSSVDLSISHPDWPEKSGAPSNALLSRATGNFSFDLLQIPAQGRSVDDVVSQATVKIESNIGSRVLEKKKTGDKAFIVYSESRNGREFLNKAIFVLHLDKIFKLVFSAPTEQFDKINDIFWKAAKSISFK